MKYLAVKNFAKYQHYRDRNPVWIKLYTDLLTDAAFLQMPEEAQAQLVKLWILASQFGHPLPNNPRLLAGKIGTTGRFHLSTMIAAGFIVPCEQLASNLIDESEQSAQCLRERGEIERELSPSPAVAVGESLLADKLASDSDRTALTAIVARSRSRAACIASLDSMLTGNDPAAVAVTLPQFGQALRDYAANAEQWNAALFRGYLKRATRPLEPPTPATSGKQASQQQTRGSAMYGKIRDLIQVTTLPGQTPHRMIPKAKVGELGIDVLKAYEQVGGAERFLNVAPSEVSFLIRDFSQALEAQQQHGAA